MRYVSVFSGVEAASCAWDGMGWEPIARWIGERIAAADEEEVR